MTDVGRQIWGNVNVSLTRRFLLITHTHAAEVIQVITVIISTTNEVENIQPHDAAQL